MTERRWSAPFITMLEALRVPSQFQAGRRLFRAGHVQYLSISSSLAAALVRDDDQTYRTRVAVRAYRPADWKAIERVLAGRAIHAARLLSGQLPEDLDQILASFGLDLFPQDLDEIAMDCPCPSWQVPCRHLAATCYAMAESFDTDPFTILAWRGRGRDDLLRRLRSLREAHRPTADAPAPPATVAGFWTAGPRLAPDTDVVGSAPPRPDAVLDQLEPLDLTAGRYQVTDLLRTAYRAIAGAPPAD
jgi:uncharacterized Zn finger protein